MTVSGDAFRLAQAGWDAERLEIQTLNTQIANAAHALELELSMANDVIVQLKQDLAKAEDLFDAQKRRAADAEQMAADSRTAATQAEVNFQEASQRADDLRRALDQAHGAFATASNEQTMFLQASTAEITQLRNEIRSVRAKAEKDAEIARLDFLKVSEETARLRGVLDGSSAGSDGSPSPT